MFWREGTDAVRSRKRTFAKPLRSQGTAALQRQGALRPLFAPISSIDQSSGLNIAFAASEAT
jgi:hypothetical protein